jgi:hypothetical protein
MAALSTLTSFNSQINNSVFYRIGYIIGSLALPAGIIFLALFLIRKGNLLMKPENQ